ncbi:hypothetical protein [Chitinophaga defluvii]|uniref:Uncharacterized protein n=1 Tax=Chitinophaga defluvii TaxID=3163343 RepID=A0ABV2TC58_9BACT
MKVSFLLAALLYTLSSFGQKASIVRVQAYYDSASVAELYNRIPVGFQLIYSDSTTRETTGFMQGNYRWSNIQASSPDGTIQNGYLTFDRAHLQRQHYQIRIKVILKDAGPVPFETTLVLPHVTGIRFNHYADSLKRGIRFYLNVEAKFSSGKILPLDTANIWFETSAGKLLGQDLLLDLGDTTRFVKVRALYKYTPRLELQSVIPVKQGPEDESKIINDVNDLYNSRPKKPKRRN